MHTLIQARENAVQLTVALDMALADLLLKSASGMVDAPEHMEDETEEPAPQRPATSSGRRPHASPPGWEDEKAIWQRMETELERQVWPLTNFNL